MTQKLEYKQTEDKWTNEVVFCLSGVSWTLVVLHALTLFVYMYSMRWTVIHESFSESPHSRRNRNKHLSSAGKQNDCKSLQKLHLASNKSSCVYDSFTWSVCAQLWGRHTVQTRLLACLHRSCIIVSAAASTGLYECVGVCQRWELWLQQLISTPSLNQVDLLVSSSSWL